MAYFANGSEGDFYEAAVCARCSHNQKPDGYNNCAIWLLHQDWNGADEEVGQILDTLIPRSGVQNDLCSMFHPSKPEYADHGENYRKWLDSQK